MKKDEEGFGALEGLLVLVIVGLLGFVGWYVRHNKSASIPSQNSKITYTSSSSRKAKANASSNTVPIGEGAAVDPYDGWKTYENKDLTITFKYPADWKLVNNLDKTESTINLQSPDYIANSVDDYTGTQIYISSIKTATETTIVSSENKDVKSVSLDSGSGYSMSQNMNDKGYRVLLYGIDLRAKGERFFLYQSNIKQGTLQKDNSTDLTVFNKILDTVKFL